MTLQQEIVRIARSYVGRRETRNNSGFQDEIFEEKMRLTGWQAGEPWCAYFAELVVREAAAGLKLESIRATVAKAFSGSATQTLRNCRETPGFVIAQEPEPGDVAIWQFGKGWQGHAGIVTEVNGKGVFTTVEGNTNSEGGREGVEVALKRRKTGQPFSAKSLNLIGFIRIA